MYNLGLAIFNKSKLNNMPNKKLLNELEKLRSEVNAVSKEDTNTREKLNSLINDIEKRVAEPGDEAHHKSLIQNITDTINQFETDHPRATAILNDIMVSLSNMGI